MTDQAHHEARQYRNDVFAEMRAADAERRQAAAWGQWSGAGPSYAKAWIAIVPIFVIVVLVVSLLSVLGSTGVVPLEIVGNLRYLSGPCLPLLIFGAAGASAFFQLRRSQSAQTAGAIAPISKVACPHCGAPNHLIAGQHVHTCGHCGGALMPSKTVMVQSLDAMRAERRRATLERYRAERRGMLGVGSYTRASTRFVPFYDLVIFAPMACTFLAGAGAVLNEAPLYAMWPFVIALAVVSVIVAGAAVVLGLRFWQRKKDWREGLAQLAHQFHGRASDRVEDFVSWLDSFWAGPYDVRHLFGGSRFAVVSLDAWGYAAVLALDPKRGPYEGAGYYPTYVRVVLAGWVPNASDGRGPPPIVPAAHATIEWLRAWGFTVSFEEAGIVAAAAPWVVYRVAREPSTVVQLAPVIAHVVRLAHEVGVQPVAPM